MSVRERSLLASHLPNIDLAEAERVSTEPIEMPISEIQEHVAPE